MRKGDGIFSDVGLVSEDDLIKIDNIITFHESQEKKMSYTNIK